MQILSHSLMEAAWDVYFLSLLSWIEEQRLKIGWTQVFLVYVLHSGAGWRPGDCSAAEKPLLNQTQTRSSELLH